MSLITLMSVPRRRPDRLEQPFEGRVAGEVRGGISGFLDAQLSDAHAVREFRGFFVRVPTVELAGMLAGTIERESDVVTIIGRFTGAIDVATARLKGQFKGTASCLAARTGKLMWQERLGRHHSASPVSAEGRLYFLDDDGTMFVLDAAPKFRLIARNTLDEPCFASPAVSRACA